MCIMGNRTLISQLWKRNIQSLPYRKGFERDPFFEKRDKKSKKSNERDRDRDRDRETERLNEWKEKIGVLPFRDQIFG